MFRTWARSYPGLALAFTSGPIMLATQYYYHARTDPNFPMAESKEYVVDARFIGHAGVSYTDLPRDYLEYICVFYPRNGDVVRAVPVPGVPSKMMLQNGLYVENRVCGRNVLRPVDEVKSNAVAASE